MSEKADAGLSGQIHPQSVVWEKPRIIGVQRHASWTIGSSHRDRHIGPARPSRNQIVLLVVLVIVLVIENGKPRTRTRTSRNNYNLRGKTKLSWMALQRSRDTIPGSAGVSPASSGLQFTTGRRDACAPRRFMGRSASHPTVATVFCRKPHPARKPLKRLGSKVRAGHRTEVRC